MPGAIIISVAERNHFRVLYESREGDRILKGPLRDSKQQAVDDAAAWRKGVAEDGRYHVARGQDGGFFFHFLGELGEHLAVSAVYPDPEGLGRAIARIKACVPVAPLLDQA